MEILDLIDRVATLSSSALTILALVGVLRGWWVPRWYFDYQCRLTDEWKRLALRGTDTADEALKLVKPSEPARW